MPGLPATVLGFNRDVAWTFTNTGADVVDVYREKLDDLKNPRSYWLDGQWKPLTARREEFRRTPPAPCLAPRPSTRITGGRCSSRATG